MDLPAQAMACMISGLEPANVTQGWNPNDGALLAEMVANKVLHAIVKGVVDGVLEVDLYDQEMYLECGVNTPLLYQPLIDRGCMKLNRKDSAGVDSVDEDKPGQAEDVDVRASRSWAEQVELSDSAN